MFHSVIYIVFTLLILKVDSFTKWYQSSRYRRHSSLSLSDHSDSSWLTVSSINENILEAADDILNKISYKIEDKYNVGVLVISSIYEQNYYQDISSILKSRIPTLQVLIGCTTGCSIGPSAPWLEPIEVETRASITLTLLSASHVESFRYDDDEIKTIISQKSSVHNMEKDKSILNLVISSESSKSYLAKFIDSYSASSKSGNTIGFIASSITALHLPKVILDRSDTLEKYGSGVVGLSLKFSNENNIDEPINVHTVVARSSLPVGPIFSIGDRDGDEIVTLQASMILSSSNI